MDQRKIEAVLNELARQQGRELNAQERLVIRTRISSALAAKERHRQRMNTTPYLWKKPDKPRR